jgi:hypothetical protein
LFVIVILLIMAKLLTLLSLASLNLAIDRTDLNRVVTQDTPTDLNLEIVEEDRCTVMDSCKWCSFRELQKVDVCQETGLRVILECTNSGAGDAENYVVNKACSEAVILADGSIDVQDGMTAIPGEQPQSLLSFFVVMLLCAVISLKVMERRKEEILEEVFSKLSIIKTKM